MKLATSNAPVEISDNGLKLNQFSIAMNAKAFRVLSDTLYQNKIGSIVRELCCNAKDAHVSANKRDIPFEVHLPDAFEPWFSVKDYGIGLSPESIADVFTVYFKSTKDDSNDTVGAFGLGAKTPFSYTDQFTVTSVCDGIRYIYSAFIAENGMPNIVEMDRSDAEGVCNGVEIKMSAKRDDYNTFRRELATQLRFFNVKPIVQNNASFTFETVGTGTVAISTPNVIVNENGNGSGAFIIQGEVGYPLDNSQVQGKISDANMQVLNSLRYYSIRLFFEIGEIGVTASREGVEYNAITIKNLNAKLDAVRKELVDHVTVKLASFPNDWEKARFLNGNAISAIAIASGITLGAVKSSNGNKYYFDLTPLITKIDPNTKRSYYIGEIKVWGNYKYKGTRDNHGPTFQPSGTKDEFKIVIRDTNSRPNIRAKHFLSEDNTINKLVEISFHADEAPADLDKLIKEISVLLGGYSVKNISKLSDVVLPVHVKDASGNARGAYTRPTYYSFDATNGTGIDYIRGYNREYDALKDVDDDLLYVVINDMSASATYYKAMQSYNSLCAIEPTPDIVAIRESDLKKIEGMTNFVDLNVHYEARMKAFSENRKAKVAWKHYVIGQLASSKLPAYVMMENTMDKIKKEAPASLVARLAMNGAKHTGKGTQQVKQMASFMGWDGNLTTKQTKHIDTLVSKIHSRYPLIKVCGDWQVRQVVDADHLAKYLRVM